MDGNLCYDDYLEGTRQILEESAKEKKSYYVSVLGKDFIVYPNVFSPKYFFDTEFFAKRIKVSKGERFLEIGSGTGVQSVFAALAGAKVTAIDINPNAVKNTKENVVLHEVGDRVIVLEGDVYGPLSSDIFYDTIYWNVPFGLVENISLSNLEKSVFDPNYNFIRKFIGGAKEYLTSDGRLLIGFSSTLGKYDLLNKILMSEGYIHRLVARTSSIETNPVFFELFEAKL